MPRRLLVVCTMVLVATSLAFGWTRTPDEKQISQSKPRANDQLAEREPTPATLAAVEMLPGDSGTPAIFLDAQQVTDVLGKSVRDSRGEDVGRIVDVIVTRDGQTRAAVLDFGGFLGVGSRKIALDWSALSFAGDGGPNHIAIDLTRDQMRLAPEYRAGAPIVVVGAIEHGSTATEDSTIEK
jgi:hypothetical protein